MKVIDDELWFCVDCMIAAVNNDYSGLDYYLSEPEASIRQGEIQRGLENLGGYPVMGDETEEFSRRGCDCCGDTLAGSRERFALLGDDDDD